MTMEDFDTGGAAFPHKRFAKEPSLYRDVVLPSSGMTLMDWFAGQAMKGHIARWGAESFGPDDAMRCYNKAQAMVAEKRRREGGNG